MQERFRDYFILSAVAAALSFPNLGATSLWDVDEGVNAQAAREMRDSGSWIVPTFNYQLRTAKPVMLYWLQRASFAVFGVSEWSARLPSVLAGWVALLLTYELARRMFGRGTGLLAGIVLASVVQFAVLSHAATPDATLLMFTTLTYLAFWAGHAHGSNRWWVATAIACGLAMLTKGPIGVGLPGLVILLYFAWNRELGRLLDRRIVWAALAFLLVAGPWYGLVANETRGEWVRAFIGRENLQRFSSSMDGHHGPLWYYLVAVLVMFAPWSAFIGAVVWYGAKGTRRDTADASVSDTVRAYRFLVCWVGIYFLVFSAAATKLPNYIFPLYPALAILTARFFVGWRDGVISVPRWVMSAGVIGTFTVALVTIAGTLAAESLFPGMRIWALLGLLPLAGAIVMARALRRDDRQRVVMAIAVASVAFVGLIVSLPPSVVDRQRAPRELVRISGVSDPDRDLRLATFYRFPPSLTYYSGREIRMLESPDKAVEFLEVPTPGYLFVTEPAWKEWIASRVTVPHRIAARHFDFMERCEILVITNDMVGGDVASR